MELLVRALRCPAPHSPGAFQAHFGAAGGRIGRGAECRLSLPDPTRRLSREHLEILYRGGRFTLALLSRLNGAEIDGRALATGEAAELAPGARIALGDYLLGVEAGAGLDPLAGGVDGALQRLARPLAEVIEARGMAGTAQRRGDASMHAIDAFLMPQAPAVAADPVAVAWRPAPVAVPGAPSATAACDDVFAGLGEWLAGTAAAVRPPRMPGTPELMAALCDALGLRAGELDDARPLDLVRRVGEALRASVPPPQSVARLLGLPERR